MPNIFIMSHLIGFCNRVININVNFHFPGHKFALFPDVVT